MKNFVFNKYLIIITIAAISIRVATSFFLFNTSESKLFEYGILAKNLASGNGYSLFVYENEKITLADSNQKNSLPSAYMMPGYTIMILPIFLCNQENAIPIIFLFQSLLSGIVVILLYKLTNQLFNKKVAFVSILLYSFLPEFIYSASTIGPTIVYHIFILGILLLFSTLRNDFKKAFSIGTVFLIGIYLRPETVLFLIIISIVLIFQSYYRLVIIAVSIVVLGLTPWIIRNFIVFDKFIPLTTSTGINLFRGHNKHFPGFWEDAYLAEKKLNVAHDKLFEANVNQMFLEETVKHIRENSEKNVFNILEKVFHLWGFYYYDSRTINIIYLLPWIGFLYLFFKSFFIHRNFSQNKFIYVYLATATLTAMLFFALPRHQTIMKIAMMPMIADGLVFYINKLKK